MCAHQIRLSPLLLVLFVLAIGGCGLGNGNPGTRPPRVTVSLPSANIVGNQTDVDVEVNGCTTVQQAALYDADRLVRNLSFDTNPLHLTLTTDDISFGNDGIAAQLALTVKVTCDDGRTGTSEVAGAIMLPVALVVGDPGTTGFVVPKYFFADGSGAQTTFVGCNFQSNGQHVLVRVNQRGQILASQDRLDVQCNDSAQFTDRGPGGIRWMLVPGTGALAFDYNMKVTSVARSPWNSNAVNVTGTVIAINPSDANALIYKEPTSNVGSSGEETVWRVKANCLPGACPIYGNEGTDSPIVWAANPGFGSSVISDGTELFRLLGSPIVVSNTAVFLPGFVNDLETNPQQPQAQHFVWSIAYGGTSGGADYLKHPAHLDGSDIPYGVIDSAHTQFMAIDPDKLVAYLPFLTQTNPPISEIRAYDAIKGGLPRTSPSFNAEIHHVVIFGGGQYLAAVSNQGIWFLNSSDLTVLNPTKPIVGHGSLVPQTVQPGPNSEVYLMFGSTTAPAFTPPAELVTFNSPLERELVRYQAGGTLAIATDDGGQLWMRFNAQLAKMLSPLEYKHLKAR